MYYMFRKFQIIGHKEPDTIVFRVGTVRGEEKQK